MKKKHTVFQNLLKYLPRHQFEKIVEKYEGDKWNKSFFCWDLLITVLHGQLSQQQSLRSVELSHRCQKEYIEHLGAKIVPLSTLSDACKVRKPEIFMEVFEHLVGKLKKSHRLPKEMGKFVHLIDATPIPLKGYGYEWAKDNYRTKGLKMHTVYDLELKSLIHFTLTDPNVNDITEAKKLEIEANGIYVCDKAYYDYGWWARIEEKGSYFVTRLKKDTPFKIVQRRSVKGKKISHDWVIKLTSQAGKKFPGYLRDIGVKLENGKSITIVTNDLKSPVEKIAELYKQRWQIELFFKCLKQNLKIKRFWGKTENAVKLQIMAALIIYVLLRLIQMVTGSAYSIKQIALIIRLTLYEYKTLHKLLREPDTPQRAKRFSWVPLGEQI